MRRFWLLDEFRQVVHLGDDRRKGLDEGNDDGDDVGDNRDDDDNSDEGGEW